MAGPVLALTCPVTLGKPPPSVSSSLKWGSYKAFVASSVDGIKVTYHSRWHQGSACSVGDARDAGSIPGSGRPPGEGNGKPVPYSCLENPMHRGAWQAAVHGAAGWDTTERSHSIAAALQLRRCRFCSCFSQWPRQGPMSGRRSEGRGQGPQARALRRDHPLPVPGRNVGLCNGKLSAMSGEEVESTEQGELAKRVGKVGSPWGSPVGRGGAARP